MLKRRRRQLELLSKDEIARMRDVGRLSATLLKRLGAMAEPGVSTQDLDDEAVAFAEKHGVKHAPYQYKGFPRSICTSVNEVVCHGIPSESVVLKEGDLVSIDTTLIQDGFHGDTCATFFVGTPSEEARKLAQVTAQSLLAGLEVVEVGNRVGDIGAAIQKYAEGLGYSVVREFQGHGIGRTFHTAPDVPHFGRKNTGTRFRPGMSFTIEPMINIGNWPVKILEDGWTAVTRDGSLSAQYEHTVIVTEDGLEIMTVADGDDPWAVSPGAVITYE